MSTDVTASIPPQPPHVSPRLAFTRKQLFGLPLLAAIPVLALSGALGEKRAAVVATSPLVAMRVAYPVKFRYRQIQSLEVTVRNVSGRPLDSVTVSLDTAYITRFAGVRIEPAPSADYVVALLDLRPGETRLVTAELWGERYGAHTGRIAAGVHGVSASATIHTFVFP